jgi:5'-deoxynucleotidase YfbR-like HD superfamily hydrolase
MKEQDPLEALFNMVALTHRFQQTKRTIYATGEDRFENDAEHSFQLALIAWYLIEKQKLPLNKEKVLLYALCHDLPEAYTGDKSFYRTKEEDKSKKELEKEAVKQLLKDHPDFPSLGATITTYEEMCDEESKFVYALDKILPVLNIQLDEGRSWEHLKISYEMFYEGKRYKVAHDPTIQKYFLLIAELLKENPHLFHQKNT